jgi:hypothetical protein
MLLNMLTDRHEVLNFCVCFWLLPSEYILKLHLTVNMLAHVHTFIFTLHTIRVRKVEKEWFQV